MGILKEIFARPVYFGDILGDILLEEQKQEDEEEEEYQNEEGQKHVSHDQSTHGRGGGGRRQSYSKRHKQWRESLSEDELKAIDSYTEIGYEAIKNCQNDKRDCSKLIKKDIRNLKSALDRAPKYEGETYRGLNFGIEERDQFVASVVANGGMVDKGFLSTSHHVKVATRFATEGEEDTNSVAGVLLTIQNKSGVDISKLSSHTEEAEVVILPGAKLRLLNVFKYKKLVVLHLEEE